MIRLAVLVSGNGSNLQALIDAINACQLEAKIVLVASNRQAAYGLVRAEQAGIPTLYFPLQSYRESGQDRIDYDAALAEQIILYRPDLIVLAGWMHVLSLAFLDRFPHRVINLHSALPGQFAGTHAIERAYDAFQRGYITHTGVMVHWVVPEVDAGQTVVMEAVPIHETDDLPDLESRIHAVEHRMIVEAIQQVISDYVIG